jgi:outer membrane protein OmpA-like peptidoglycan-associated protein
MKRYVWLLLAVLAAGVFVCGTGLSQESPPGMLDTLNHYGRLSLYIEFDDDNATVRPESQPLIAEIVAALQADPALRLTIEGHTDDSGTERANMALSERRAAAVVRAIVAGGIAPGRVTAAGFGETSPIADNSTETGRARNRRIEVVKVR